MKERFKLAMFSMVALGVTLILSGASAETVHAQDTTATIILSKNKRERTKLIKFDPRKVEVEVEEIDGKTRAVVNIEGSLRKKGFGLKYKDQRVIEQGSDSTEFTFQVPLKGRVTPVTLYLINKAGKRKKVRIGVKFPNWKEFKKSLDGGDVKASKKSGKSKRFSAGVGIGPSLINYAENTTLATVDLSMIVITAKASVKYVVFPPRWDIGANVFMTAFSLSNTYGDTTTASISSVANSTDIRFLGGNLRVGYAFIDKPKFKLSLLAGWYYTTMMVTNDVFGFTGLAGPQLFPAARFRIGSKSFLTTYAKFSPVIGLDFANREIAGGLGYVMALGSGALFVNLDIANIAFSLSAAESANPGTVDSTSFSLSAGYGF